jgi:hypothetical protein
VPKLILDSNKKLKDAFGVNKEPNSSHFDLIIK